VHHVGNFVWFNYVILYLKTEVQRLQYTFPI